jgi:hypothetical protein
MDKELTTGLPGLDQVLQGLVAGDNVVLGVDAVEDYRPFVDAYCRAALQQRRRFIYFRFARHDALVPEGNGVEVHELDPEVGFERFLNEIVDVIESGGLGTFYLFDCLSDLAVDWYSDRMLANFFMITCPFLYRLETITYFALLRNHHSSFAIDGIHNTAQVLLDIYRNRERLYVQPLKVDGRYSPTMYTLHEWSGADFHPVTSSATISEILASLPQPWLDFTINRAGVWRLISREAHSVLERERNGLASPAEVNHCRERLVRMLLSRDERFIQLAEKYFELTDLVEVLQRMIGTGLIGGKSLGMLLARLILKRSDPEWHDKLEAHDSFFVGSDVFYTYVVTNGIWWDRREMMRGDLAETLERAAGARRKIMAGEFPADIRHQFMEMLDYFGQSPIIVRSSSLLEDNYGNAFSGKYESVFCANQGTPEERLESFVSAVRTVYASALSEDALVYRSLRCLLERDEQMALLVQRVSGEAHGNIYFPQIAGVGFSFNPYVWSPEIDPCAGVLRLVSGLGTRAVDRTGDDYTRLVPLNVPALRREQTVEQQRQYSQRRLDVLDLERDKLATRDFSEIGRTVGTYPLELLATHDHDLAERARRTSMRNVFPWILSFDKLFSETPFITDMRSMLSTLEEAYASPVDVEYTANLLGDGSLRIDLVQCRPFQVRVEGAAASVSWPTDLSEDRVLLRTHGPIIGQSSALDVDRLIYVVPSAYSRLSMNQRHGLARLIGKLNRLSSPETMTMLVGPGRWGTSTPALGVPVSFAEINTISVICEVALMHEGLVPDVSLGTHFFNDMVELGMVYLAVSPGRQNDVLDLEYFVAAENRLLDLVPDAGQWAEVVFVLEGGTANGGRIRLNVDSLSQRAVCYV